MGYNSHPKIMKKLFYSFFMLVAMSLTFVACEQSTPEPEQKPEPEVEEVQSNCKLYKVTEQLQQDGNALYQFQFTTDDLNVSEQTGSGDYLILMIYAKPQEDSAPVAKTYNYLNFGDFYNFPEECLLGGAVLKNNETGEQQLAGTFAYVIENGQAKDLIFCNEGNVKFEGNATKGLLTATLKFTSGTEEGKTYEREYIYNGPINVSSRSVSRAPQMTMPEAFKITNLSINY